jgi:hypothetical protein
MLGAIKLKGKIQPDRRLEIPKLPPELPEGEVELILLYERQQISETDALLSPLSWPVLDGGQYLGGTLRREELYDDDGR